MDYYKIINRTAQISANKRNVVDLESEVWSQDLNITKIILTLETTGPAIDLTDATVRVVMAYDQSVKIEADGIVEDVATQKIGYVLDNRLAGFEGTVTVAFYVTLNTGQRIDIQNYKINFRKSLIDDTTKSDVEPYFDSLETIISDARHKVENMFDDLDVDSTYFKDIKDRLTILESREDHDTIYDDTEIKNRLTTLESRPSSSYDDTEIKNKITQLESDISTRTNYDDSEIRERITTLENRNVDVQPYDDSEVKERLTNLEIKSGAEGNTEGNASYQSFMENLSQLKYAAYGFVSSDVYGVEVDMVNKTVIRISGSIGKSGGKDFDNIRAYQRRRCNLTDDGKVLAYFGDYGYVENGFTDKEIIKDGITYPAGTRVQVMVEQPKFYYRVIPLVLEPIPNSIGFHMRKGRYYICDTKKEGFKVHPAFEKDGVEKDLIYLSAYEACIFTK